MRMFHIGGRLLASLEQSKVELNNGFVKFIDLNVVEGRKPSWL